MIQLKASTVIKDHCYVWPGDPALGRPDPKDFEDETEFPPALEAWEGEYDAAMEGNDPSRLPLLPNEKASIFWLRHPSATLKRWLLDLCHDKITLVGGKARLTCEHTVARKVASLCLVRAENLGMELDLNSAEDLASGFPCVSPKSMDVLESCPGLIDGLSARVFRQLNPSPS